MNMILGLTEGSWTPIVIFFLGLFTTIMGIALRATQKSGNLNTMKTMDEKFDIEMDKKVRPINKRLANAETDIKEIRQDVNAHTTSQAVTDTKMDSILLTLAEIKELVK